MMAMLNSIRDYTSQHVNPLLADKLQQETNFVSESVPAFAAREAFENLRGNPDYSDFLYKEAALNPTNPRDLADPFETQLLNTFRSNPATTELHGFTMRDGAEVFYNSRPLIVTKESCLSCHSTSQKAPASLVKTYGSTAGFGWQMNQVVAAQTIYVPAQAVFDQAQQALLLVMGIVIAIFAIVIVATYTFLRRAVVRPVVQIAGLAHLISAETLTPDSPELAPVNAIAQRSDEFGFMAKVLGRMAKEIYEREQKLKQQIQSLRIQIDTDKQITEVKQITESDYFQNLQQRVKQIRKRADDSKTQADSPDEEAT